MEDSFIHNNSNNLNINYSHVQCNITSVLNSIKNKKDARWFCLMNRMYFLFRIIYA